MNSLVKLKLKIRSFVRDLYYDVVSWLIEQRLQTIDFIVWVMSVVLWNSFSFREQFYEYRKQSWHQIGTRPDFQQFVRSKFFGD